MHEGSALAYACRLRDRSITNLRRTGRVRAQVQCASGVGGAGGSGADAVLQASGARPHAAAPPPQRAPGVFRALQAARGRERARMCAPPPLSYCTACCPLLPTASSNSHPHATTKQRRQSRCVFGQFCACPYFRSGAYKAALAICLNPMYHIRHCRNPSEASMLTSSAGACTSGVRCAQHVRSGTCSGSKRCSQDGCTNCRGDSSRPQGNGSGGARERHASRHRSIPVHALSYHSGCFFLTITFCIGCLRRVVSYRT